MSRKAERLLGPLESAVERAIAVILAAAGAAVGIAYLIGAHATFLWWLLRVGGLLVGLFVLSVLRENIAGNESFSLPLGSIFLFGLVGAVLAVWFEWIPVLAILALFLVNAVVSGLRERIVMRYGRRDRVRVGDRDGIRIRDRVGDRSAAVSGDGFPVLIRVFRRVIVARWDLI